MRIASLSERREFYSREFSLAKIRDWFRGWQSPIVFAVVIGRHTRIAPRKYLRERARTIVIDEYEGLSEIKNYLIDFRPESVYYDRNVYKDWDQARSVGNDATRLGRAFGQELVFDVDPENFTCPIHGTLEDKMRKHQGLSFCRARTSIGETRSSSARRDTLKEVHPDQSRLFGPRISHSHYRRGDRLLEPKQTACPSSIAH